MAKYRIVESKYKSYSVYHIEEYSVMLETGWLNRRPKGRWRWMQAPLEATETKESCEAYIKKLLTPPEYPVVTVVGTYG